MVCIGVVIPTYNEKDNIVKLLDGLREVFTRLGYDYRILVVDDNSPDGTARVVEEYGLRYGGVEVLIRPGKLGIGSAIRDGLRKLLEYPEITHFVTMDADLSHRPEDLETMLKYIDQADIVQGSRYVKGGCIIGWGFKRRIISWGANTLIRLLYRTGIRDHTGNYRVYNRRVVEDILKYTEYNGYEWVVEAILVAKRLGYRIIEAPITFINRERGESKLGVSDILKWFKSIIKLKTRRYKTVQNQG